MLDEVRNAIQQKWSVHSTSLLKNLLTPLTGNASDS